MRKFSPVKVFGLSLLLVSCSGSSDVDIEQESNTSESKVEEVILSNDEITSLAKLTEDQAGILEESKFNTSKNPSESPPTFNPLLPTYLPSDFELADIEVSSVESWETLSDQGKRLYSTIYYNPADNSCFVISATAYGGGPPYYYEEIQTVDTVFGKIEVGYTETDQVTGGESLGSAFFYKSDDDSNEFYQYEFFSPAIDPESFTPWNGCVMMSPDEFVKVIESLRYFSVNSEPQKQFLSSVSNDEVHK